MTAPPPSEPGAAHVSDTEESADVEVTAVGAPGVVMAVADDDQDEYDPVPTALVAATRNWYWRPTTRPVRV